MILKERKLWKDVSLEEIKKFVQNEYAKNHEDPCPVDKLMKFTDSVRRTSCGECVICREGTLQLYTVADGITRGIGRDGDVEILTEVSSDMIIGSTCDYGKEVGRVAVGIVEEGKEQFEKHIKRKRCDALVCRKFFSYYVSPEKCTGCGQCAAQCEEKAIAGGRGLIHIINSSLCSRCGSCVKVCPEAAIGKAGAVLPDLPAEPVPVGSFLVETQKPGGLMAGKRRRRSE